MAAATAIAATGVLISAGSAGMSFSQAAKARRQGETAAAASKKLMKEAERKAEVEFMQKLNVPLDAYGREYKQNLQVQQQGIQALQEGDARTVAAGVGRVGALAGQQGEQTRIAMGEALYANNKMKADSKQAVNQQLIKMNVGAAADQNMRRRDAMRQENQGMQQAMSGLGSALSAGNDMVNLYQGDENTRAFKRLSAEDKAQFTDANGIQMSDEKILEQIQQMDNAQRKNLKKGNFDFGQVQIDGTGTMGQYSSGAQLYQQANQLDPTIPTELILDPNLMGLGGNASGFNSVYKY